MLEEESRKGAELHLCSRYEREKGRGSQRKRGVLQLEGRSVHGRWGREDRKAEGGSAHVSKKSGRKDMHSILIHIL